MLGVRNTVLFSTPFKTEPSLQELIWRINNTTFASNISIQGTAPVPFPLQNFLTPTTWFFKIGITVLVHEENLKAPFLVFVMI